MSRPEGALSRPRHAARYSWGVRRVLILISGAGTNMHALLDALTPAHGGGAGDNGSAAVNVVAVGADRDAPGLAHAAARSIHTFVEPWQRGGDRDQWAARLGDRIDGFDPDLIVLSGFMRILPAAFVQRFSPRIINTHPALLPAFPGANAVRDALAAGATETGATIHIVDAGMDTGPVISQRAVPILPGDTETTLHDRIKQAERTILIATVLGIANGDINLHALAARRTTQ